MSNIELLRANEQLFATTEELLTVSSDLVEMRLSEERLGAADCKLIPSSRQMSDAESARSPFDLYAKRVPSELQPSSIRLAFCSGADGSTVKRWSILDQVQADVEDETCQLFGVVGGFLLDTIRADRIRLNTEKVSDGLIKIMAITYLKRPNTYSMYGPKRPASLAA